MKKSNLCAVLTACIALFASCNQAPKPVAIAEPVKPDLAQIRTDIKAIETAFCAAWNAKNADAALTYYADDAQSLFDKMPTLVGKAGIRKHLEEDFANNKTNQSLITEVVEVFADGNLVVEVATASARETSGKIVPWGRFMAVFEKRNGKYVCIRDINNDVKK